MENPTRGTVRVIGRELTHDCKVEVFDGEGWIPLRRVVAVHWIGDARGDPLTKLRLELIGEELEAIMPPDRGLEVVREVLRAAQPEGD